MDEPGDALAGVIIAPAAHGENPDRPRYPVPGFCRRGKSIGHRSQRVTGLSLACHAGQFIYQIFRVRLVEKIFFPALIPRYKVIQHVRSLMLPLLRLQVDDFRNGLSEIVIRKLRQLSENGSAAGNPLPHNFCLNGLPVRHHRETRCRTGGIDEWHENVEGNFSIRVDDGSPPVHHDSSRRIFNPFEGRRQKINAGRGQQVIFPDQHLRRFLQTSEKNFYLAGVKPGQPGNLGSQPFKWVTQRVGGIAAHLRNTALPVPANGFHDTLLAVTRTDFQQVEGIFQQIHELPGQFFRERNKKRSNRLSFQLGQVLQKKTGESGELKSC